MSKSSEPPEVTYKEGREQEAALLNLLIIAIKNLIVAKCVKRGPSARITKLLAKLDKAVRRRNDCIKFQ